MKSLVLSLSLFALSAVPVLAHEGPDHDVHASAPVLRIYKTAQSLQNIVDRIDVRATIIAERGIDASAARPFLEEARTALSAAEMPITEAMHVQTPERDVIREIASRLITAHASLMDALLILKTADASAEGTTVEPAPEVQ